MTRWMFILVCFLIVSGNVHAEPFQEQWDWHAPVLFGNVKLIVREENVYTIKEIFDQQGRQIEEQWLNRGRIIQKTIFRYDDQGRLYRLDKLSSEGKVLMRDEAFYEKNRIKFLKSSREPGQGKFYYDAEGFLDEIVVFEDNGDRVGKYVYRFNQYGQLIERRILNALLELREKEVYFYNQKGIPAGIVTYNAEGAMVRKDIFKYTYDPKGNWKTKETASEVYIGQKKGKAAPHIEKRKLTYF